MHDPTHHLFDMAASRRPVLTVEQQRRFFRDGYLHLPRAVPQRLIREARRWINIDRASAAAWRPLGDAGGRTPLASRKHDRVQRAVARLFNESDVKPLLESGLGVEVPAARSGQARLSVPPHGHHR